MPLLPLLLLLLSEVTPPVIHLLCMSLYTSSRMLVVLPMLVEKVWSRVAPKKMPLMRHDRAPECCTVERLPEKVTSWGLNAVAALDAVYSSRVLRVAVRFCEAVSAASERRCVTFKVACATYFAWRSAVTAASCDAETVLCSSATRSCVKRR